MTKTNECVCSCVLPSDICGQGSAMHLCMAWQPMSAQIDWLPVDTLVQSLDTDSPGSTFRRGEEVVGCTKGRLIVNLVTDKLSRVELKSVAGQRPPLSLLF